MGEFGFSQADLADDGSWMKALKRTQTGDVGRLKTSSSKDQDIHLGVTTLTVSEILQGSGLEKPEAVTYSRFNTALTGDLNSLIGENGIGSVFTGSKATMLPYDVLMASKTGPKSEAVEPGTPPAAGGYNATASGNTAIPPELEKYGNGKIPASALVPIGIGSHRLWEPAAVSFRAMKAASDAAGVPLSVTDSYRSYEAQYAINKDGDGYKDGTRTPAARPGKSNHGWGTAVDAILKGGNSFTSPGYKWLLENAAKYGWVNPEWAKPVNLGGKDNSGLEPWHWEFRGSRQ